MYSTNGRRGNRWRRRCGSRKSAAWKLVLCTQRIKAMVDSGYEVYDRKTDSMRPVQYRDFVILLRSMPWAPQIMEELKLQGIPSIR